MNDRPFELPGKDSPRNWPEDFSHENGNYFNECMGCGEQFIGHKRRPYCKVCATPKND